MLNNRNIAHSNIQKRKKSLTMTMMVLMMVVLMTMRRRRMTTMEEMMIMTMMMMMTLMTLPVTNTDPEKYQTHPIQKSLNPDKPIHC